jgi:hypothetical protein
MEVTQCGILFLSLPEKFDTVQAIYFECTYLKIRTVNVNFEFAR